MKKSILFLASMLVLATSCYEDYVRDFDYSAVFIAYQYDMRTFVLDEGGKFNLSVALSGVMQNDEDRNVEIIMEPALLDGAVANMKDIKQASGEYVSSEIAAAGISELKLLPEEYYTVEGMEGLYIPKGQHTAAITLRATEQIKSDPKVFAPYYALAFRVIEAEADTLVQGKDFAVIAVKCENRFYGNWSRSGKVLTYDASGNQVSSSYEAKSLADEKCYTLTSVNATKLEVNRVAGSSGSMELTFDGDQIAVSSADGSVSGTGRFDGNKLLQSRRLFLNYTVTDAAGGRSEVTDTLYFRNRIRDGVNEWIDENPENYK